MSDMTWVFHPTLVRWSEIVDESVPVWEEAGWEHRPEGPAVDESGRYSEVELAARAAQLGIAAVEPEAGVSIETPEKEPSTEPASLKKDSGKP